MVHNLIKQISTMVYIQSFVKMSGPWTQLYNWLFILCFLAPLLTLNEALICLFSRVTRVCLYTILFLLFTKKCPPFI